MENMNSINNEFGADTQSMKERRGSFLLVLVILSWVTTGFGLFGTLSTYLMGESAYASQIDLLNEGTGISFLDNVMSEATLQLELILESFQAYHISNVIMFLLGTFSVYLMFKLKKNGFYLYILYCVLGLFIQNYFLGEVNTNGMTMITNGLISVIFIIMYAVNLKRMND